MGCLIVEDEPRIARDSGRSAGCRAGMAADGDLPGPLHMAAHARAPLPRAAGRPEMGPRARGMRRMRARRERRALALTGRESRLLASLHRQRAVSPGELLAPLPGQDDPRATRATVARPGRDTGIRRGFGSRVAAP